MGCDFTFIHTADLHLGSRFRGLTEKNPGLGAKMCDAVFESFHRIVDLGIEKADFMVISGDLYDEASMTPRTRHMFASEASRFKKPIFVVKGNHDFGDAWEDTIPYPDNVRLFPTEPKTVRMTIRGRNVDVIGISYGEWHTTDNLASKLSGRSDAYTIGMVHCSIKEIAESEDYALCSLNDLLGKGIDYWALGHIHKRTVVKAHDPPVIYPGNIQGRNSKESGEKGCYLVSVEGNRTSYEFIPTQSVIWYDAVVDITGHSNINTLHEQIESPEGSFVRITFAGSGPLNKTIRNDPEGIAFSIGRRINCNTTLGDVRTCPEIDIQTLRNGKDLMSEIVRTGDSLATMTDQELIDLICVGPASDVRGELMKLAESGMLKTILAEAELSLLTRISEGSQ